MKLIYIAGPYRPYTNACGALVDTAHNISIAELTAVHLVDTLGHLGLFPVVPHLNTRDFENQVKQNNDQYFLDGTMAMLERCDAVLLTMPNADAISIGTKAEVHRAHQLGIQVYRSFDALRRAAQENQIVRLPIPQILPDRTGLQGMYELLRRNEEETHRFFMQMSPGVGKARDTDGPLEVYDFSKLEDRVLATLTETSVAAVNLRPGDVLSSGDVVNSTKHLGDLTIEVNWANGTSERYHYAEIFKVVLRRVGG
ncbi:deoxyribosyltransferase [Klebsiella phage vB_KpnS_MAG26fr]|nr:deoxyribosyltransferase [Klebsiella phage vB_KpnS_MAG26fr]